MKITKELKHATFEWDEDQKNFTITQDNGDAVTLNKVYAFAFMRFVVRMAQRNWLRNKKIANKRDKSSIDLEEDSMNNSNQLFIFKDE